MTHPELQSIPAMRPVDDAAQQPLRLDQILAGQSRALPTPLRVDPAAPAPAAPAEEPLPPPPTITSLAELEALASRPVLPSNDHEAAPAPKPAALVHDIEPATFGPAAIRCEPSMPTLVQAELDARITHDLFDRLTGLAEHRWLWPLAHKAETERRILAQLDGLLCLGAPSFAWLATAPAASPWATWAIVFALANLEGREPLEAIHQHLTQLAVDQPSHRQRAAEAFAASGNPHVIPLARACMATPGCEPFALELLSLKQLLRPEDLQAWLRQPSPEIQATALRACTRLEGPPPNVTELERLVHTTDPLLAWEAARALTFWGSGAALSALRHPGAHGGPPLLDVLGPQALELLVLTGHLDDAHLAQRLIRRLEPTASLLDTVARLGHPGTWAYLAHYLRDPILADDAVAALRVTFGDLVAHADRHDPFAWEPAIGRLRLDDSTRIRRGKPWSAAVVAEECRDPQLTARDIDRRLDELRARHNIRLAAPLWALTPLHQTLVSDLQAKIPRQGASR